MIRLALPQPADGLLGELPLGATTSLELLVVNDAGVVAGARLVVLMAGQIEPWARAVPETVSLEPGASASVNLVLTPSTETVLAPGEIDLTVRALPTVGGAGPAGDSPEAEPLAEIMASMVVGEHRDIAIELEPKSSRGPRRGKYTVVVRNRGNVALQPAFRFKPLTTLKPTFGRAGKLEPASVAQLRLAVKPRRRGIDSHSFEVEVVDDGDRTSTSNVEKGSFQQTRRSLVPLMLLLPLLIGGMVLFRAVNKEPPVTTGTPRGFVEPPDPPEILDVVTGLGSMRMIWSPTPSPQLSGYRIYEISCVGDKKNPRRLLHETGPSETIASLDLQPGTRCVGLRAFNSGGESPDAGFNEKTASEATRAALATGVSVAPSAPADPGQSRFSAIALSGGRVKLSWDPLPGSDFYEISDSANRTFVSNSTPTERAGYRPGEHCFRLVAVKGVVRSEPSPSACTSVLPEAPTDVAVVGGTRSATITWSPPLDPGQIQVMEGTTPRAVVSADLGRVVLERVAANPTQHCYQLFNITQGLRSAKGSASSCVNVTDVIDDRCFGLQPTLVAVANDPNGTSGTPGNDVILGTVGNDIIRGMGGTDVICGLAGNDTVLIEGNESARVDVGAGDDVIVGSLGADTIIAGPGDDNVRAGAGNDSVTGDSSDTAVGGNDTLDGGDGDDDIDGGAGADTIRGGNGADSLTAGAGGDTIDGGAGADTIDGGSENDVISGDNPADVAAGDADQITGGLGDDTISGGGGDDKIAGEAGTDRMRGDGGNDALDGGADADVIFGGDGDDTITGGGANDTLFGDNGNDDIDGGDGNDGIRGGPGADRLSGGDGFDALWGLCRLPSEPDANCDASLDDSGDDLFGGPGVDSLTGGPNADRLTGGPDLDSFVSDNCATEPQDRQRDEPSQSFTESCDQDR